MLQYKQLPWDMTPPKNSTKAAYGTLNVTYQGPVHQCAPLLSVLNGGPKYVSKYPLRAEIMNEVSILFSQGRSYGYGRFSML